jgi:hypothetical protein
VAGALDLGDADLRAVVDLEGDGVVGRHRHRLVVLVDDLVGEDGDGAGRAGREVRDPAAGGRCAGRRPAESIVWSSQANRYQSSETVTGSLNVMVTSRVRADPDVAVGGS